MSTALHSSQPAARADDRSDLVAVDSSLKAPLIVFTGLGLLWLLLGTLFAFITSFQVHSPDFLSGSVWWTYGRVEAAEETLLLYGWGINVLLGVGFWLLGRLGKVSAAGYAGIIVTGALAWNLGVKLGVWQILAVGPSGMPGLQFPSWISTFLFVSYILVAAWALVAIFRRRVRPLFASQWYLFAALLFFPWLLSSVAVMLYSAPVRGVVQAILTAWYAHNLVALCLIPTALAILYYLIPKLTGKAIYSYYLAPLGFWFWLIFQGWAGVRNLTGGPIPAWVPSAGIVSLLLALIAVVIIGINFLGTLAGSYGAVRSSFSLKFGIFSVFAFLAVSALEATTSLRGASEVLQFTSFTAAVSNAKLYGIFSMAVFGALYFILPRALNKAWPSTMLANAHFWATAFGIVLSVLSLALGGLAHGSAMNDPEMPFMQALQAGWPWLQLNTAAMALLLLGQAAFLLNFFGILRAPRAESSAALFGTPRSLEIKAS